LIQWSLHTHSEHWQHFQSVFLSLAVGQIQHLPHCPVGFEKKHTILKQQYMCQMMIILCQWDFNEQIEKIGKIVALYQRELFKNIPRLGTFCTQSLNKGLTKV
jgi:hypothetical protein